MARTQIDAAELAKSLRYVPETGEIFRLHQSPKARVPLERPVGAVNGDGYVVVKVRGVMFRAHRVAWALMTGEWPRNQIDHINGCRTDNRASNLRDVPAKLNSYNRKNWGPGSVTTGLVGVRKLASGRFMTHIKVDGVKRPLGTYDTAEQAQQVYLAAKLQLHAVEI